MNADQENYDAVRRLLALKRYEQPPPGYFDRFSREVTARIKAGELGDKDASLDEMFGQVPWLARLWQAFQTKPILAGAFGASVCGVLLCGLMFSDTLSRPGDATAAPATVAKSSQIWDTATPVAGVGFDQTGAAPAASSTAPLLPTQNSGLLFGDIPTTAQSRFVSITGN